jgi:hypothetical protein
MRQPINKRAAACALDLLVEHSRILRELTPLRYEPQSREEITEWKLETYGMIHSIAYARSLGLVYGILVGYGHVVDGPVGEDVEAAMAVHGIVFPKAQTSDLGWSKEEIALKREQGLKRENAALKETLFEISKLAAYMDSAVMGHNKEPLRESAIWHWKRWTARGKRSSRS